MSIPVISPIEIRLGEPGIRRLPPPPDYEIHALPAAAILTAEAPTDPAFVALDEMEQATRASEYHDHLWWDERIRLVRTQLEKSAGSSS